MNSDVIDPPDEKIEVKYINIKGRREHEAILRDHDKMRSLGLDPYFESMVYLKRWGGWLEDPREEQPKKLKNIFKNSGKCTFNFPALGIDPPKVIIRMSAKEYIKNE